jgi:hypothetical protein
MLNFWQKKIKYLKISLVTYVLPIFVHSPIMPADEGLMKVIIRPQGDPSIKEYPVGITGWGAQLISGPKASFYKPGDKECPDIDGIDCWKDYCVFSYPSTLLRKKMVEKAIELYNEILKIKNVQALEIVGLSQGGAVALLLTDVVRLGAIKEAIKTGKPAEFIKDCLDADVVAQENKIKSSNNIKSIRLVTIGAPVSTESNAIMQHNVKETAPLVTKHLHLFSDNDSVARLDPGISSHYWHGILGYGLARKFPQPTNVREGRFQQVRMDELDKSNSRQTETIKKPGHFDFVFHIGKENVDKIHEQVQLFPGTSFFTSSCETLVACQDDSPVTFSNNFWLRKSFVTPTITVCTILACIKSYFRKNKKEAGKKSKQTAKPNVETTIVPSDMTNVSSAQQASA